MRMQDQPLGEPGHALPHAETLGEDHIRTQRIEGFRHARTVSPQLTQVEPTCIDVSDRHLLNAQGRVEDARSVRMDHR